MNDARSAFSIGHMVAGVGVHHVTLPEPLKPLKSHCEEAAIHVQHCMVLGVHVRAMSRSE